MTALIPTSTPELEALLAPLHGDSATGESLRFDPLYDEMKKLREEEDASLPQGIWKRELKKADWLGVAKLCTEALTSRTKDLQVAAWLTEAWVNIHGFAGLERGLSLMAGLCREFWPDLHPLIEEDGSLDARLAPIAWSADKLVLPIKRVPITAPRNEDAQSYGWGDFETGIYLSNLVKTDSTAAAKAEGRGMVSQSKFSVSVSLTPAEWFARVFGELKAASAAVDELDRVLTERCGVVDAPSLTSLRTPLVAIHAYVSRVLEERRAKGELGPELVEAELVRERASDVAVEGVVFPDGGRRATDNHRITTRADAYARLTEASDYLMRTEPHSPVPYLIKRAISWGNMSLTDLLAELLAKNADLATVYALLGMKKPG